MRRKPFALERRVALWLVLLFPGMASALPASPGTDAVCADRLADRPALERLRVAMADGRFIAYEPTSLSIHDGQAHAADPASIRSDLRVLRPRFDSLVTYGALTGHEAIPSIAAALHFRALIIGVWNPFDAAELDAALLAARRYPKLVVGVSLGNETIFAGRRQAEELAARIAAIRARAPGLPLSTTEPFHVLYDPATRRLQHELDFLLVNVHPVFQPWFRSASDANAARFVTDVVGRLEGTFCGPIMVKETGVPTEPSSVGFTANRQASFYRELRRELRPGRMAAFAYFAAFDAPWRAADEQASPGVHPEESHWGLFDEHRKPKPIVQEIPILALAAGVTGLRRDGNEGIIGR